jgi:hypothetical protein
MFQSKSIAMALDLKHLHTGTIPRREETEHRFF